MKIRTLLKPVLVTACCVVCVSIVNAKPSDGKSRHGMKELHAATAKDSQSHGNSAFGHRQRNASTRTKGSQNNTYGRNNAVRHRSHSTKKNGANGKTKSTQPGNSAFGHRQGDAATRTTGSQNNAYGKSQSASAHAKHTSANDDASAPPAPSPGE